jgi:hypothetical protein
MRVRRRANISRSTKGSIQIDVTVEIEGNEGGESNASKLATKVAEILGLDTAVVDDAIKQAREELEEEPANSDEHKNAEDLLRFLTLEQYRALEHEFPFVEG